MGSRWSGPGGGGSAAARPPSTGSGSSAHTASTVPADVAAAVTPGPADSPADKAKSSTLPAKTSGVAGFLRRKPSAKSASASVTEATDRRSPDSAPAASGSGGTGGVGKNKGKPKKGVGSALRSSLFKKKGKTTPVVATSGTDDTAAAGAGSAADKDHPPGERGSASPPKAQRPPSRTSQGSGDASARRKTPSPSPRKTPSPSSHKQASPPASNISQPDHKSPTTDNANKASPSAAAAPAAVASGSGGNQQTKALTPAAKEALKKQWFTDGQPPEPEPSAGRRSARPSTLASRTRPAAPDDASAPPAKTSRISGVAQSLAAKSGAKVELRPQTKGLRKSGGAGGDKSPEKSARKGGGKLEDGGKGKADAKQKASEAKMGAKDKNSKDMEKKGTSQKMENTFVSSGKVENEDGKAGVKKDTKKNEPAIEKPSNFSANDNLSPSLDQDHAKPAMDVDEPKADKETTWRHGDNVSGELGLGGISQKDRQERSERPSEAKPNIGDLDFLSSIIETSPKPAKSPQQRKKNDTSSKAKKADEKDVGMDELMDLAIGFDTAAISKAASAAEREPPPAADMDKFLDFMSMEPAKPSAPPLPTGGEISEPTADVVKTWRTGDDDDEKMTELKNKPRDFDAPAQPPDWDIDDLIMEATPSTAKQSKAKSNVANVESGSSIKNKAPDDKVFSGFEDFLASSLSSKDDQTTGIGSRASQKESEKGKDKVQKSDRELSGFDAFLSESLAIKEPASEASTFVPDEEPVAAPKTVSSVDAAPSSASVSEEILSAAILSQTTAKPTGKQSPTTDKHVHKEGNTRGSCPDHGHGVRDVLYDGKDKTGRKTSNSKGDSKHREPEILDDLIRPVKASPTSSAPHIETVVAQTASTTESPFKPASKATDKHVEKEGNTRGSVPDHGHGVRDVLYDDSDKTGKKKHKSKGDSKRHEPADLDDLIRPAKASSTSSAPHKEESLVAQTATATELTSTSAGKVSDKHIEKEGSTRGSVPDHGHGVRDVLYDDSDKTGKNKPESKDSGHRKPAVLDDLIQPVKAASTFSAPHPETVVAQTASTTEFSSKPAVKATGQHVQKEGNTRGSVPDHGHGVRDVLYDDSDKTGKKKPESKDSKQHEPSNLDNVIRPAKAASTSSAPHNDEVVVAQSAATTESSSKPSDKKATDKHVEKDGNTRGSCPDHGHGVRDLLYDDSDKTGQNEKHHSASKAREPAVLDDLIQPKNAAVSHSEPHEAAKITAEKSHQSHAAPTHDESHSKSGDSCGASCDAACAKHASRHGDTRGSCPDHGHGVRGVLYPDTDRTGLDGDHGVHQTGGDPHRQPADLDHLVLKSGKPPAAAAAAAAVPSGPNKAEEKAVLTGSSNSKKEEKVVAAAVAHATHSAPPPQTPAVKQGASANADHVSKEGNTRGSAPDHGHGVRDLLYDDSDKTGLSSGKEAAGNGDGQQPRKPADVDDLVRPTAAARVQTEAVKKGDVAAAGDAPVVASSAHSAPPAAAKEPPRKSVSLAGMTDPDDDEDDNGEELRRLIASTEALQQRLHACGPHNDSKQVQEQAGRELAALERHLEQKERRLESTGRGHEVRAAKEGLLKVKQQLDASKAAPAAAAARSK